MPFPWDQARLERLAGELLERLFPLCRSLTGPGNRQSLAILREVADFAMKEVPSGTACYDWTVPPEWNLRAARLEDSQGRRILDLARSNLHVVGYSEPVDAWLSLEDLRPHLHSLPGQPQAIPYRTAYYQPAWGFCLAHQDLEALDPGLRYHAVIDAELAPGSLTYGEALLPGTSGREFLISTYCCHPSLANDNLSGMVAWALLLKMMRERPRRHAYRFVIAPETIGALAYLSLNEQAMRGLEGGLVLTCLAGPGPYGYKQSFKGDSTLDQAVRLALRDQGLEYVAYPFEPKGSDERQFSSPFFRIPVGTVCKSKYYEYPEYHTSQDDLGFISAENLVNTLGICRLALEHLEMDRPYRSLNPQGEPQLGRRGLYPALGGRPQAASSAPDRWAGEMDAMLWLLFHADGETSLLEVARSTGLAVDLLHGAATRLQESGLLEPADQ